MLNVTYKPFVLNVVMLSVIRLNVVMLSAVAPKNHITMRLRVLGSTVIEKFKYLGIFK